jgi:hypothetical protein
MDCVDIALCGGLLGIGVLVILYNVYDWFDWLTW